MTQFRIVLRACSLVFLLVATLHGLLGVGADRLLGIAIDRALGSEVMAGLDSQNRFYGVALGLYAAVLWIVASDLERYRPMLYAALGCLFKAGGARWISASLYGWPPPAVIGLLVVELVAPPLVFAWARMLR